MGSASFATTLSTVAAVGQVISATATDPSGNTSEFSASIQVVDSSSPNNVAILQIRSTARPSLLPRQWEAASPHRLPRRRRCAAGGCQFPFGFVTFRSRITPGATADVTISGLDVSSITDYYKYGATPAVHSALVRLPVRSADRRRRAAAPAWKSSAETSCCTSSMADAAMMILPRTGRSSILAAR